MDMAIVRSPMDSIRDQCAEAIVMGGHVQNHLHTTDRHTMVAPVMDVKILTTSCGVQQLQILTKIESGATAFVVKYSFC